MASHIRIEHVYKIFGHNPAPALELVKSGLNKEDVLAQTDHTVGLDDISLDIKSGKIFVVMGLSGSGKSTLIRHINRLIDPTEGSIYIEDLDILSLTKPQLQTFRREKVSMVFQRFGLMPHKSVLDNVGFGLLTRGVKTQERHRIANECIEKVGLTGFGHQYPSQLSGGMQQRVGLARALATDPSILLMDEAFSALDPLIRSDMQAQLLALQKKLKKTIVFITHDLDEALRLGDSIAILNGGRLAQVGRPEDIVLKPADDYVSSFVVDVSKARVLRARHAMISIKTAPVPEDVTHSFNRETFLDSIIPIMLKTGNKPVAVTDNKDQVVGHITQETLGKMLD